MTRLMHRRTLLGTGVLAGAGAAWTSMSSSWSARFLRDRVAEWGRDVPPAPQSRYPPHGMTTRSRSRGSGTPPCSSTSTACASSPIPTLFSRIGVDLGLGSFGPLRLVQCALAAGRAARDRSRARLARALRSPRHALARRHPRQARRGHGGSDIGPAAPAALFVCHGAALERIDEGRHAVTARRWSARSRSTTGAPASGATSIAATPASSSSAKGAGC